MKSDDTNAKIAKKLLAARLKNGHTQADIARLADVNVSYYAKVERAQAAPTVPWLEKVAKANGLKLSDILPS